MNKVILNLSSVDFGGAGKFAVDFNELLRSGGYESYLVIKDSKTENKNVIKYPISKIDNLTNKIKKRIMKILYRNNKFNKDYHFYNKFEQLSIVKSKKLLALLPKKPDIILLFWISDFINAKTISELYKSTNAKIYWLLIDNAPLTGGCHYPWTCLGYTNDCSHCPAVINKHLNRLPKNNLLFKRRNLPDNISIITFSNTDHTRTKLSSLFKGKNIFKMIAYVNDSVFNPGNKKTARSYLNLDVDKKIIFIGVASIHDRRKGIILLIDALLKAYNKDYQLLIAGNLNLEVGNYLAKHIGYVSENDLVVAYQAADLFVCSSIEDSGPIMINQSLMCGTPVVAFNIGVAGDLVITDKTGYKALTNDSDDLAKGIIKILTLSQDETLHLSRECRKLAINTYGKESVLNKLNVLFQ